MPTGPKGERRPADVIGNAVKVMRIATGEETDEMPRDQAEYTREGGLKGGAAHSAKLSEARRVEIAKKAAAARWSHRQKKATD